MNYYNKKILSAVILIAAFFVLMQSANVYAKTLDLTAKIGLSSYGLKVDGTAVAKGSVIKLDSTKVLIFNATFNDPGFGATVTPVLTIYQGTTTASTDPAIKETPFTIENGQNKQIGFTVPLGKAGDYNAKVEFIDENSNAVVPAVTFSYQVMGDPIVVNSIVADKTSGIAADSMVALTANFTARDAASVKSLGYFYTEIKVYNELGTQIGDASSPLAFTGATSTIKYAFKANQPATAIRAEISILKNGAPMLTASFKLSPNFDAAVLTASQKAPTQEPASAYGPSFIALLVMLLLIVIVLAILIVKKMKGHALMIAFALLAGGLYALPSHQAQATVSYCASPYVSGSLPAQTANNTMSSDQFTQARNDGVASNGVSGLRIVVTNTSATVFNATGCYAPLMFIDFKVYDNIVNPNSQTFYRRTPGVTYVPPYADGYGFTGSPLTCGSQYQQYCGPSASPKHTLPVSLNLETPSCAYQSDLLWVGDPGPANWTAEWAWVYATLNGTLTKYALVQNVPSSGVGYCVAPSAPPATVTATASCGGTINVSWSASSSTGGAAPTGYKVYRDGILLAGSLPASQLSYSDTSAGTSGSHTYSVSSYNSGGESNQTSSNSATSGSCGSAPTVPSSVSATAGSCSSGTLNVSWTASTGSPTGYSVYRDGSLVATVNGGTSYADTGLAAGSSHTYKVSAFNSIGTSGQSASSAAATAPIMCPAGFNYSIQANDISVAAGTSQINNINVHLISGATQPVQAVMEGVTVAMNDNPSVFGAKTAYAANAGGITLAFNPSTADTCTPNTDCAAPVTITVPQAAPGGTYTVSYHGHTAGLTDQPGQFHFSLTVTPYVPPNGGGGTGTAIVSIVSDDSNTPFAPPQNKYIGLAIDAQNGVQAVSNTYTGLTPGSHNFFASYPGAGYTKTVGTCNTSGCTPTFVSATCDSANCTLPGGASVAGGGTTYVVFKYTSTGQSSSGFSCVPTNPADGSTAYHAPLGQPVLWVASGSTAGSPSYSWTSVDNTVTSHFTTQSVNSLPIQYSTIGSKTMTVSDGSTIVQCITASGSTLLPVNTQPGYKEF